MPDQDPVHQRHPVETPALAAPAPRPRGRPASPVEQTTDQWHNDYKIRAGVEGTMRQATHVTGIRRARYLSLPKITLEHNLAAAAINLIRYDAWLTETPLDRTRTTHLQRLFTQAA
ncbi:MAG: transposase [Pseudonocardiaceae bacterium]